MLDFQNDEIEETCHITIIERTYFHEAVQQSEWKAAIEEEIRMIENTEMLELIEKPSYKKGIGGK